MEKAEEYRCRARIIELGVCEFLREHGYTGATIAATAMLMDATRSRSHAEECVSRAKLNLPPETTEPMPPPAPPRKRAPGARRSR